MTGRPYKETRAKHAKRKFSGHKQQRRKANVDPGHEMACHTKSEQPTANAKSTKDIVRGKDASVIDDIFCSKKAHVSNKMLAQPAMASNSASGKQTKHHSSVAFTGNGKRIQGSKDDLFAEEPQKQRKYDAEGLPIFSEEELNIGKGKDTADCPFDCNCCF